MPHGQGQQLWLGGMGDFRVSEGLFPGLSGSFLCEIHQLVHS